MKHIFPIFILFLFLTSCESNPLEVDVSDINVELEFHRYDVDMFTSNDAEALGDVSADLYAKTGELYEFYTMEMLRVGSPKDDSIAIYLNYFVRDSMMGLVFDSVQTKFGDFKSEENQIIDMFKHLKYHIPQVLLPTDIATYNSTFTNGVVSSETQIGLGLEMYLGSDSEIIKQLPYPEYFKTKMDKQYLMSDIAQSWLVNNVIEDQSGEDFLSHMLYYGKVLYVVDAMLPEAPSHEKLRYTELEYEWSEVSEYNVWQHIVEQDWIYSSDIKLIVRYFNEGPTTVGLEGSPARYGQYLGWKVIHAYMEKNPEVTILELIAEKNQTKLLKAYKPKELN